MALLPPLRHNFCYQKWLAGWSYCGMWYVCLVSGLTHLDDPEPNHYLHSFIHSTHSKTLEKVISQACWDASLIVWFYCQEGELTTGGDTRIFILDEPEQLKDKRGLSSISFPSSYCREESWSFRRDLSSLSRWQPPVSDFVPPTWKLKPAGDQSDTIGWCVVFYSERHQSKRRA